MLLSTRVSETDYPHQERGAAGVSRACTVRDGRKPEQPSLFISGAADPANELSAPTYNQLESYLPNLRQKVLLEGVGHSAAEEKPEEVNRMLLEFLAAV